MDIRRVFLAVGAKFLNRPVINVNFVFTSVNLSQSECCTTIQTEAVFTTQVLRFSINLHLVKLIVRTLMLVCKTKEQFWKVVPCWVVTRQSGNGTKT
jgi:hypothetical protein